MNQNYLTVLVVKSIPNEHFFFLATSGWNEICGCRYTSTPLYSKSQSVLIFYCASFDFCRINPQRKPSKIKVRIRRKRLGFGSGCLYSLVCHSLTQPSTTCSVLQLQGSQLSLLHKFPVPLAELLARNYRLWAKPIFPRFQKTGETIWIF